MNAFEHLFCSSSLWRYLNRHKILPWILSGANLGDHVLEVGAGYGAATAYLHKHAGRVTSLEYDPASARKLKVQHRGIPGVVLCGDASQLPFADHSFSSAIAILVLHHLKSKELQDRAFAEVFRVLRPGGVFLLFEIHDSWIHHVGHIYSTFTPLPAASAAIRLAAAGFSDVVVDSRPGAYRLAATRPS